MRVAIASRQAPVPEGTAPGRILLGLCDGLRELGHEVEVWYWGRERPLGELPDYCEWRPLPGEPLLRTKARALVRPRSDIVRAGWRPPDDALAVADDTVSFPAVALAPRNVLTVHYATALDVRALGRRAARDLQDVRAERTFVRRAAVGTAYSDRVAAHFGGLLTPVPAALREPDPLPFVDEPVALMLANWEWPPNAAALGRLLAGWPEVRSRVPAARLLLAGRGDPGVGCLPGVTVLGEVPRSADALSRAAVLAFPCPPTSGPKIKVIEAAGAGLPVVTTPAGAEGVGFTADGVTVADDAGFAAALAGLLADPERRARQAAQARECFRAVHAPVPAAQARLAAWAPLLTVPA